MNAKFFEFQRESYKAPQHHTTPASLSWEMIAKSAENCSKYALTSSTSIECFMPHIWSLQFNLNYLQLGK
jgi:hypothetical protein